MTESRTGEKIIFWAEKMLEEKLELKKVLRTMKPILKVIRELSENPKLNMASQTRIANKMDTHRGIVNRKVHKLLSIGWIEIQQTGLYGKVRKDGTTKECKIDSMIECRKPFRLTVDGKNFMDALDKKPDLIVKEMKQRIKNKTTKETLSLLKRKDHTRDLREKIIEPFLKEFPSYNSTGIYDRYDEVLHLPYRGQELRTEFNEPLLFEDLKFHLKDFGNLLGRFKKISKKIFEKREEIFKELISAISDHLGLDYAWNSTDGNYFEKGYVTWLYDRLLSFYCTHTKKRLSYEDYYKACSLPPKNLAPLSIDKTMDEIHHIEVMQYIVLDDMFIQEDARNYNNSKEEFSAKRNKDMNKYMKQLPKTSIGLEIQRVANQLNEAVELHDKIIFVLTKSEDTLFTDNCKYLEGLYLSK